MKHPKLPATQQAFVNQIRLIEERLFPDELCADDPSRMKSEGGHYWQYRPSHHIATGLLTQENVTFLSEPGRRLLSVGAYPAFLEKVLVELGVPSENILLTDNNPALSQSSDSMQTIIFDLCDAWPAMGTFDRIIFPESLCISITDTIKRRGDHRDVQESDGPHASDAIDTEILTGVLRQAFIRLRTGGILRANGPMRHPNILRAMSAKLTQEGLAHAMDSRRFFLAMWPRSSVF